MGALIRGWEQTAWPYGAARGIKSVDASSIERREQDCWEMSMSSLFFQPPIWLQVDSM